MAILGLYFTAVVNNDPKLSSFIVLSLFGDFKSLGSGSLVFALNKSYCKCSLLYPPIIS